MTFIPFRTIMSGEVRKGERIPRREPPAFEEAESVIESGLETVSSTAALDDANQFGPITMMLLLLIVAAITGTAINFLAKFHNGLPSTRQTSNPRLRRC